MDLPHFLELAPGVLGLSKGTSWVQGCSDEGADHGSLAKNIELEAVGGDERDVLAGAVHGVRDSIEPGLEPGFARCERKQALA